MKGTNLRAQLLCAVSLFAILYTQTAQADDDAAPQQLRDWVTQALDGKPHARHRARHQLKIQNPQTIAKALQDPEQWTTQSPTGRITGFLKAQNRRNPFILRVPEGYTPDRTWPLHISLHGGLKAPHNNCDEHWQEGLVDQGVILLCPSTYKGNWWRFGGEPSILEGLRYVTARYRVDTARISIGGASMGGRGTWMMAARHPWLWSAAAPRCGPLPTPRENLLNVEHLPLYLLHGSLDNMVNVEHSRHAKNLLSDHGYPIRYEELPDVPHSFMRERNASVAQWLLEQTPRSPDAAFTYRLDTRPARPNRIHWLRFDWGAASKQEGWVTASLISANACDWLPGSPCPDFNWITIHTPTHANAVTVLLTEGMWAPDKPVRVEYNGRVVFEGHVEPSAHAVLQSWRDYRSTASPITPWAVQIDLKASARDHVALVHNTRTSHAKHTTGPHKRTTKPRKQRRNTAKPQHETR